MSSSVLLRVLDHPYDSPTVSAIVWTILQVSRRPSTHPTTIGDYRITPHHCRHHTEDPYCPPSYTHSHSMCCFQVCTNHCAASYPFVSDRVPLLLGIPLCEGHFLPTTSLLLCFLLFCYDYHLNSP